MTLLKEVPKRRGLQSWKEIATYLGVTVRSVQRWERSAGLPILRQGQGRRSRVFAYSDELQHWLDSGGIRYREEEATPEFSRRRWVSYAWLAGIASTLAVCGLVLWHTGAFSRSGVPHGWVLEGSRLKVMDARGRICWEKQFPPFHTSFETAVPDKVLIVDIDGDGRTEVLFNLLPENLADAGGSLMCFESDGRLRWEFHYGRPKTFGTRTFEPSYRGRLIRPVRVAGKPRLLTVANHFLWYPSQVALLDPATGRLIEEYWHPGSIVHCIVHDIDQDGQDEAIFAAINNPGQGLGHAALGALKLPFSKAGRPAAAPGQPLPAGNRRRRTGLRALSPPRRLQGNGHPAVAG